MGISSHSTLAGRGCHGIKWLLVILITECLTVTLCVCVDSVPGSLSGHTYVQDDTQRIVQTSKF